MKKFLFVIIAFLFAIFFVSNTFAQNDYTAPTGTPIPTPTPVGQILSLDFTVPGIGTESGNLNPQHLKRNVVLNFYNPNINSQDPSVQPLASVATTAVFDSNESDPTFGEFVNTYIDLGNQVPDGSYQISFKTDNSLPTLVKVHDDDVGGKVFDVKNSFSPPISISNQTVVVGDIYPAGGDNVMDIKDYNALTGCFGDKATTDSCFDKEAADLNDDGRVDGTDYNLMLTSFKILLARGLPVPSILVLNKPIPTKKVVKKVTPAPKIAKKNVNAQKSTPKKSSPILSIIIIFFVIILVIGLIVYLMKKRRKNLPFDKTLADKQKNQEENGANAKDIVEKEFFVKKQSIDENGVSVLTLTDDSGPMLGYYKGEVQDGYYKVKGVIKKDDNKVSMQISEITQPT